MTNDQIINATKSTLNQVNKLTLQALSLLSQLQLVSGPIIVPPITTVTTPPSTHPPATTIGTVRMFDIHCEKPESSSSKYGVILSEADFNILKQNDHVFTVIPVNPTPFTGIPNISIHDLNIWIKNESITSVP